MNISDAEYNISNLKVINIFMIFLPVAIDCKNILLGLGICISTK